MRSIAVTAVLLAAGSRLQAQDLEYTSTTRFTISPTLGLSGMMGAGRSVSSHVYIKGTRLRFDVGTQSSLIDVAQRQITFLDHARRTARTMKLTRNIDARADSLADALGAVVTVQRASRPQRINGVDARRTTIVVRVPARNPHAAKAADLVVTSDLWTTESGAIGRSYARVAEFADQLGAGAATVFGMMAQNPRVAAAMHKATQAGAQVRGLPVRTVLASGNVPAGRAFRAGMPLDTVMAVTTVVSEVRTVSLAPALFDTPAGYTVQPR